MPFDIASGDGYVSSTAKFKLTGAIGTAAKPTKAMFKAKKKGLSDGSDTNVQSSVTTLANPIKMTVSLNI